MNNDKIYIDELSRERDKLIRVIREQQAELDVIQKLIAKRMSANPELTTKPYFKKNLRTPLQALKIIFRDNPKQSFNPGQLRDELDKLRNEGQLKSNANKLLFVTHSALKSLLKKNIIVKNENTLPPSYYLSEDLQGKLI